MRKIQKEDAVLMAYYRLKYYVSTTGLSLAGSCREGTYLQVTRYYMWTSTRELELNYYYYHYCKSVSNWNKFEDEIGRAHV